MQNVFFYLGNPQVQVPEPDNWQELMLELSFENSSPDSILNATNLIWKGQNAAYMNDWVLKGLTGGVGIFEGIPLTIKICDTDDVVFNGIVDLTDSETTFACDTIKVKIRDSKMDMVSQLFDSVSYAYLATPVTAGGGGAINPSPKSAGGDYVVIPYQKNDVPDYVQIFTLGITIFVLVDRIIDITNKMTGLIVGETTAVANTTAKSGADADGSILGMFYLIGYIVYLSLLLYILYELIKSAFNYLVSPVFTKFGMYAKDLMQKACDYFKIGFASTIFASAPFSELVIMPEKSAWSDNRTFINTLFTQHSLAAGTTLNNRMEYDDLYNYQHNGSSSGNEINFGAYGYYDGTPGDFIRAMSEVFNAKAKIILDSSGKRVCHFERWDHNYNVSTYKLPNISDQVPFNSNGLFNTSGQSRSAFRTNASELAANYRLRYQMDDNDVNTYNAYEGTMCYCTTRPIVVSDISNVVLQHLRQRDMPFAQAFRKDQNTVPEIILQPIYAAFATIYNIIIGPINAFTSVYNVVANWFSIPPLAFIPNISISAPFSALGHMLLTNHVTGVPKMFIAGPYQTYGSLPFFSDWNGRTFSGVTIDPNNRGQLNSAAPNISARALVRDFHFSSLPQSVTPSNAALSAPYLPGTNYFNQYLILKNQQIPLCCSDYQTIKNNNVITTFDGEEARVDSLKANLFKGLGNIDYRIKHQYTNNLLVTFVIDGKIMTKTL